MWKNDEKGENEGWMKVLMGLELVKKEMVGFAQMAKKQLYEKMQKLGQIGEML